jgi:hypothetical protein
LPNPLSPVHSSLVAITSSSKALPSTHPQKDNVAQKSYSECKVRLSFFLFSLVYKLFTVP